MDLSPALTPVAAPQPGDETRPFLKTRRGAYVLLVVVPTLLALAYLGLVASPQYQSNAEYVIRGMQPQPRAPSALAELIGGTQAGSSAGAEAGTVRDFLQSPDAIAALKRRGIDVVKLYHRPDVDFFSRLRFARPRAETLLDYYRDHVIVDYDKEEGVTRLGVRAFAPGDAQAVARALIELGEGQVNANNQRALAAGIAVAQADLAGAEAELVRIQGTLTGFRDVTGDIDPQRSGEGGRAQVQQVEGELARQQAELAAMRQVLAPSSPQVITQQGRVATLQSAAGALRAGLTGGGDSAARRLASFEELKLRQDFAAKRYETARAALEAAKSRVAQQRLFFVAVVTPNLPEKPVRPTPLRTSLAVLIGLTVAFAIGWLILAGVREHQAD
ncbi:MAG: capsule biosynthesis protein [Pseudomonadota bacterium]